MLASVSLAAVLLAMVGCERGRMAARSARPQPAAKVVVVKAEKRDVPIIAHPNGTTRSLSEVTVRARVKGFLKEKHFEEGSNVKKGRLLLVIEEDPFAAQVAQSKAKLEAALADLEKATKSKSREVASAQVNLSNASLELARVEERREANLLAKAAASRENFDRMQAARKKSEAQVEADKASLQQANADYDANVLIAKANVEKAKADLAVAEIDLGYCRMFSPIDGRMGQLQVKLGNLVGPAAGSTDTTSLVTIQQLDPMGVDVRPASRFLPIITELVKSHLKVDLRVQGEKTHPHSGEVVFLDNTVDPTTSTVLIKAKVPNPDETLLPGEYVKVDLTIGDYAGAVVIPEVAVEEAQEGSRVLAVDSQNKVQAAVVKPMDTFRGLLVLESGLEAGQRVIVEGLQVARVGQAVEPEERSLDSFMTAEPTTEAPDPLSSPLMRIRGKQTGTPPESKPSPKPAPGG
jgi:RND family efflux transporter MFP subunit